MHMLVCVGLFKKTLILAYCWLLWDMLKVLLVFMVIYKVIKKTGG